MNKKIFITLALLVFSVTMASAQAVGTYKASKARTVTEKIKKQRKEKIKKPHNPLFLGVNAGLSGTIGTIQSLDFALGVDMAFSKTEKFAWGFFTGYETLSKADIGLLFVHGNYVKGGAFFWGLGYSKIFEYKKELDYEGVSFCRHYDGYRLLLRLGFQQKSPLYYNITLSCGGLTRWDEHSAPEYRNNIFGAAITVGYRFNTKQKIIKNQ